MFTYIWQGGLLCLIFGLIDNSILQVGNSYRWTGWVAYVAFGLFVVQTVVLSVVVGLNSRKHGVWWLFFVWSLGLINLQLFLINHEAGSHSGKSGIAFTAFVYAFFAAQIGLTIFWAICCTLPRLRLRLPLAAVILAIACHPFWTEQANMNQARQWLGLLTLFIVAATLTFGVLRYFRFQLGLPSESADQTVAGAQGQFGIKHLFIWTTIVAFLFGLGNLVGGTVGWDVVLDSFFGRTSVINFGMVLLVTVSLVAVVWAVMGESKQVWIHCAVLLVFLLVVAFGLQFLDRRTLLANSRSLAIGWCWNGQTNAQQDFELIRVWMIWTMLNGMFLASLFMVFRFAGFRFMKSSKKPAKAGK